MFLRPPTMPFAVVLRTFFATWLLIYPFTAALGQASYRLSDTSIVHRLDKHLEVFIDSTNRLTFKQILRPEFQKKFKANGGNLTFGYLESTLWLKVETRAGSPLTRWMLEIPAPFLEYVDFYQWEGTDWRRYVSGYYRKESEKQFSHTGHVLPLKFQQDLSNVVYVRIAGLSPKTFPVYAVEASKFSEKNRFADLGYGIFFGILIVMFFYNLFIYIILRHRSYLFYFCTIVCTFLLFSAISGYGGKFLWPEKPFLNYLTGKLTLELLVIFLSIFTIRFLEVKKYSMVMYYMMVSLVVLAVVALIMVATKTFPFAGNTLASFSTVVFMATGIVVRLKGNKMGDYFIAAWSIYFAGGLLITLRNSGVLDYGFWTTHFVEIGAVLETTIIGFALGHQYRKYKKEKEAAQMHALKIQEEAMAWLEKKVRERTEELSSAYKHLRQTLETNEKQTILIQNKNSELDSFFYRISHDLKGPISSALGLTMLGKIEASDGHSLDLFERLRLQLERISNIFNGLITLAQRSDGTLESERIDFDKMIDGCIASCHALANFSKIAFTKEISPDIQFHSEWTLLNGILQNLIENSIKYARAENPRVRISVHQESEWVILQVEDNGQGIEPERLPRIFDLFYRGTENETGAGLGLYILKRSVERLNGMIEVTSDGTGSTFVVRLPSMKGVEREVKV